MATPRCNCNIIISRDFGFRISTLSLSAATKKLNPHFNRRNRSKHECNTHSLRDSDPVPIRSERKLARYIQANGIQKMKFYVSAKDARKGSVKTTVPADTVAARRISSRTVLVLGIVFLLSFVRVAVLVLESSAVCSTFGNSSFPISFLLFVRNSCFYCFVVDSSVRKTVECETSTYE